MLSMSVTLDVSMLSGWLKAVASCVEIRKQGIRTVRGELCAGDRAVQGARAGERTRRRQNVAGSEGLVGNSAP